MLCPNCNHSVSDGSRFCGSCGQALDSSHPNPSTAGPQATLIRPPLAAAAGMGGPQMAGAGGGGGAGASAAAAGSAAWGAAAARLPGLFERIKNILVSPKTEWPVIEPEPTSIAGLYTGYVMPLAAFAAIISFLRMSVIGVGTLFGGSFRVPLVSGLTYALVSFGFGLLGLFLVGLIINALAPTFSGEKNQRQALKVAAYAFTPAWLSSVFGLLGGLGTLLSLVAGIYGIYLLYLGLPLLMRSAKEKAGGYTAAVVICTFLLGILLMALSAATGLYGGRFGGSGFGGLGSPVLTPQQQQEQAAAAAGNILGSMLGTDDKGKASIGAAMNNLAAAGQQMEAQEAATNGGSAHATTAAAAGAATAGAAATDPTQNAAAATAGLLTALGGALGGGRRVEPVDFHTLKGMLPDSLPGMQRTNAQASSQQALGVKGSSATAQYQGPAGARAEIQIADISGVAGLVDMANSVAAGTQSESDTGYEKETTVGGRRAHEKWDNSSRHGEVTVIVAKRFSVSVTGDGVDMSTLEQYAGAVNFAQLESMKDAGAQAP